MIQLTKKCTGCGACATVCPKNAIEIKLNKNGFYAPVINENKCINCGLCKSVCIDTIKDKAMGLNSNQNYIAASKNSNIFERSSSGGIAYIIAKKLIEKGYAVCGVQYNKEKEIAEHTIIKEKNDLRKIQGSKYIQSYTLEAFKKIIKYDKAVVFGTPCQIAGLDAVLKKKEKRQNFVLIDIFCHGVPSMLAFKNHLKYLKDNSKIRDNEEVVFRQKKNYILKVGNSYNKSFQYDAFYYLFLRGLVFQEACYTCPYRRNSYSDIRLGDFTSEKYRNLSISPSNIIINTELGKKVINIIQEDIDLFRESYEKVDKVQDKGEKEMPTLRSKYLYYLKEGKAPDDFLKKELFESYLKGYAKNIIRIIERKNTKENKTLRDILDKEMDK